MFTFKTKVSMAKAILTKNSPFYIQFYISKYCHQKCKMCNIVEANADLKPFSGEMIEKIADNLVRIGAGVVLLTGGEPFMRSDIDEIVKIFKSKGLDVRMQTAGLIAKKDKIKECVNVGARDINVSIDSLDEKKSDYINGLDGSWSDAIKTISYISSTFPSKDSICALGCVLSKYNVDEIDAILDFATKIGWWLSLVPVHITSSDKPMNFRGYDDFFSFSKSDYSKIKELIERLKKKKKLGYNLFDSDDYLDSIYTFIKTGKPSWRNKGVCDSPNLYFAILPDGSFAPCCDYRFSEKVYVYDNEFPRIFKSRMFRDKVKKITSKCSGCNFGSYPEMTLSARSFSTIKERLLLQMKAQVSGLKPYSEEELFKLINTIKKDYPDYYKKVDKLAVRDKKYWPRAKNIPENLWSNKCK